MKKVLFLIHDLGVGGAEKVLVSLVNHLDKSKFEVHVIALFGGGINEQYLKPEINYKYVWKHTIPGNSRLMKLLSPEELHRICIKQEYDIEIAFLESAISRIISGCPIKHTKLYSWIHIEQRGPERGAGSFRSYEEAEKCYKKFNKIICVSKNVKECFQHNFPSVSEPVVLHNIVESEKITELSKESVDDICFDGKEILIAAVGKISKRKGFDRLARIVLRLRTEGYPVHLLALGVGPDQTEIERFIEKNHISKYYTFLGYQTNPYKYVAKCDLFVCASLAEGYSTAATEALIVGTPVCTVDVSGMKEMLGENNEWGIITENNEQALYRGIRELISDKELLGIYKRKAIERGKTFSVEESLNAIENLLLKE